MLDRTNFFSLQKYHSKCVSPPKKIIILTFRNATTTSAEKKIGYEKCISIDVKARVKKAFLIYPSSHLLRKKKKEKYSRFNNLAICFHGTADKKLKSNNQSMLPRQAVTSWKGKRKL